MVDKGVISFKEGFAINARIRIITLAVILAVVGALPATAQLPEVKDLSLRQMASEMVQHYGRYASESAEGYQGVAPTVSADQKTIFSVADQRVRRPKKSPYDAAFEIVPVMVSVIRVTGPTKQGSRDAFRGTRSDYRLADRACRTYPVRFGYYHPTRGSAVWVSGWYTEAPLPSWQPTSKALVARLTKAGHDALSMRRKNLGDLYRMPGEDVVIAGKTSQANAIKAWRGMFWDSMLHQDKPLVKRASNPTNARQAAIAALWHGGLKASIVIVDFPGLF